jgi:hypothetical protein
LAPRIPNTRGWIYRELQDFDSAIRVNQEGTGMSHEMRFPEGIASSHILGRAAAFPRKRTSVSIIATRRE